MWMTQPPSNQNVGPRTPLKIWMPLYHFHLDLAHATVMVMLSGRALLCELMLIAFFLLLVIYVGRRLAELMLFILLSMVHVQVLYTMQCLTRVMLHSQISRNFTLFTEQQSLKIIQHTFTKPDELVKIKFTDREKQC